ncbi:hypothetical protein ES703_38232 [subsurface metagenome]
MAKPKSPLLSLGARGSIGDTLTFQKRGRLTIARQKPIPTDPKTDLQLAQRQVYREAIAAWNTLTPEEKEAYRGVCPGLTPYQCYMKTALAYVPPVPPPEEYTEEQTQYDESYTIYAVIRPAVGQRLTIANRQLTKLGFWLKKHGSPTADITFRIRRVSDNGLIAEKVWGNAADLPETDTYEEVTLDTPVTINEEVRISPWYEAGDGNNCVRVSSKGADVKANEVHTSYLSEEWSDDGSRDCTYRYKYYLP